VPTDHAYSSPEALAGAGLYMYSRYADGAFSTASTRDTGFRHLTGYRLNSFADLSAWLSVVHAEDKDLVEKACRRLLDGKPADIRYRLLTKTGSVVWISDKARPVLVDSSVVRIDGLLQDVTLAMQAEQSLKDAESRLRIALENSPIAIFSQDASLRYTWLYNPQYVENEAAALGKTDFDIFPHDEALLSTAIKQSILNDERSVRGEFTLTKDGKTTHLDLIGEPIRDRTGAVVGITCASMDITERRLAEERARASNRRFGSVFENTSVGVAVLDSQGNIVSANDALCAFFGVPVLTQREQRLFSEHIGARPKKCQSGDSVTACTFESAFEQADGSRVWGQVEVSSVWDPDGRLANAIVMCVDATQRHAAEEALRANQLLLQRILDSLSSFICIVDAHSQKPSYLNGAARRLLGLATDRDAQMRPITDIVHPDDLKAWGIFCEKVISADGDANAVADVRFLNSSGEWRWMNVRGVVFARASDGSAAECLFSGIDTTREKESSQRLERYQQDLARLASESTLTEERERQQIATVLHDQVSQPLAMARMLLRDVRKAVDDDPRAALMDNVVELLEESLQQTRNLSFELSPPILSELGFEAAVDWLCEDMEKRFGLSVRLRRPPNTTALGYETAIIMYQAVREVLVNVVKHSESRRAAVTIRRTKGNLVVQVEDRGKGFEVSQEQDGHGVGGFGLFSIHEHLKYLGGNLTVTSQIGRGTTCVLQVPVPRA